MTNDTKIQPALTADEWESRAFSEWDSERPNSLAVAVDAQGDPSIYTVTPLTWDETIKDWRVGLGERQRIDIENRHALAALALYGQPFGFTRSDVAYLRFNATYGRKIDAYMLEIADRIAALLPPNDHA